MTYRHVFRSFILVLLLCTVVTFGVVAQDGPSLGVSVLPEAAIPLGARAENYQFGLGARLETLLSPASLTAIAPMLEVGYGIVPLSLGEGSLISSTNLSLIRAGLGAKAAYPLAGTLSLHARAAAGGFYGLLRGDASGESPGVVWSAGGGVGLQITSRFLLQVDASYSSYVGLYNGLTIGLGLVSRVAGPGSVIVPREINLDRRPDSLPDTIRFSGIELTRVFPALFKYYDTSPIGRATLVNEGDEPLENVEVRLMLQQFMDAPKLSARIATLGPGEETTVELYALFTEGILGITEGARLAAELEATYSAGGLTGRSAEVVTLETFDRNALQWDDDWKVAAFVTARDEQVQSFARNVASTIREDQIDAVSRELQLAIAMLGSMDVHGCAYVVDPSSSYAELSENPLAIDSVQFPRQTLQFRAGDCDDLSVTYAAMLESVGVRTAFITVPGHIFMALRLEMSEREAQQTFSRLDDLIFRDDGVWIPIETTILDEGFVRAWATGAQQWRRYAPVGEAGFFSTEEAWSRYEPVAFNVSTFEVAPPPADRVVSTFRRELDTFVEQEIQLRERPLLGRLERDPGHSPTNNRLGVLYARFGRVNEAERYFLRAVTDREFAPALANLGNVELLRGDPASARDYYARALAADDDNVGALAGLARVQYELEQFADAQQTFARIESIDSEVADRLSYLGGGTQSGRAADPETAAESVLWGE